MAGQWREPLPERPRNLDEALDRGFDPHEVDRYVTPEPLTPEWQDALDGSIVNARHRLSGDDDMCGERCDRCNDRMCAVYGPEPRVCGVTCADCPCDCTGCLQVREEARADLQAQIERESQ